MNRTITLFLLFLLTSSLVACQRGGGQGAEGTPDPLSTLPPLSTPPSPVVEEGDQDGSFEVGEIPGADTGADSEADTAASPAATSASNTTDFSGQFANLRFAASANGEPQVNFPVGTQEVYAIWDYDGMEATDTMERLWYYNDALEVEVREAWDYGKYGSAGTVRDVFYYDYIDGVDQGTWRVELYLNGVLQWAEEFTVGGP